MMFETNSLPVQRVTIGSGSYTVEILPRVYSFMSVSLDLETHRLYGPSGAKLLCDSHFRAMRALLRASGAVVSHAEMLRELYPDPGKMPSDAGGCLRQVILHLKKWVAEIGAADRVEIYGLRRCGYLIRTKRAARPVTSL